MIKYHFEVELQMREGNLVLLKNCDDRQTGTVCRKVVFAKSAVQISKFLGEIMKSKSKIIVQVIFHTNEDFNNLRK